MKNGDVIHADQVSESGNRVTYEVGDNSFTIPRSQVEKIDVIASRPSNAAPVQMPTIIPDVEIDANQPLLEKILKGGEVDRGALAEIESRGNPKEIALAYYIAARTEFQQGKFADARRDLESGLRDDPENPALLNYYAAALLRTGDPLSAARYAEKACAIVPDSPDAFAVLGYAQFAAGRVRDAIVSWKKSLALRPDDSIQAMLERAEREDSAEKSYSEHQTGHFVLHYEGERTSEAFREQLLETLESHYRDLSSQFESEPHSSVQVILYTNKAFFDVTRAPAWMGALNDGTLRIPVDGLSSVTPELSRILHHELTHSFVNQLTLGRCPQWLNEGVAQLMESRQLGSRLPRLAELFKQHEEIPINQLESGFSSFGNAEATLAYDESLATVEYLRDAYGMTSIVGALQRIGKGESAEAALRETVQLDYRGLEDAVREHLERQSN